MKRLSADCDHKFHLKGAARELALPRDGRPVLLFAGRLGFVLQPADLDSVEIAHKPTREMDELYIGFPQKYSQLTHLSIPVELSPGEALHIHRPHPYYRGVLVVDKHGRFEPARTEAFVDPVFRAALNHDLTLSHGQTVITAGPEHSVTIQDLGSRNGTEIFIPALGQTLLAQNQPI